MSELLIQISELRGNKDPVRQFAIGQLSAAGVVLPERRDIVVDPSIHPRFSLDSQWCQQVDLLAYLFAKPLGKSRWQYMDGLPQFPAQPKESLNIPTIVQTPRVDKGLTLVRMLSILEVAHDEGTVKRFEDWKGDPAGFVTPDNPYSTWLSDGSRKPDFKPVSPTQVRQNLAEDERGGNVSDGLALARIAYPAVLRDHYLDLPGSQLGSVGAPVLVLVDGRPWLYSDFVGRALPVFGSVVAGRNIVVGNLFS